MRSLVLLLCLFLSLSLRAAAIAVFYAEQSVPESERRYARALAGHVQRWYQEAGLEADLLPDALLADRAALKEKGTRVAILVDCYSPPAPLVEAVQARVGEGMRFVVCYSASEALAKVFGLKLGKYVRSDKGEWSLMRFGAKRLAGAPREILQTSTNLFTVQAISTDVKPVAEWCDRAGRPTAVAWWQARGGHYWMTHILTGDGDERGKQRLLLAIAAETVPGVWRQAANHLYRACSEQLEKTPLVLRERTSTYYHSAEAVRARRKQLANTVALLQRQREAIERTLKRDSAETYQAVCDFRELLNRAYGMTYWSRAGEICGVWDHTGQGLYPGDWPRTAKLLAESGITDLYVNVAGAAFALYPSKILPQRGQEDCLAAAIAACRAERIRVHAWILAFSPERAVGSSALTQARQRGWLLQDAAGKELNWLDPTHPEVRARLLETVKEIASTYKPDGIHLDFIRYPGLPQTLGPRVRARFEAERGKAANWPACVSEGNGARRRDFLQWRAAKMTDAVQAVRSWLRGAHPRIQLSAAVYGKYPACVDSVGQDWLSWLRTGLIDAALPMNYTEDLTRLNSWLDTQTTDSRLAARIVSGVGVTAAESRLSPVQVLEQIQAARKAGCHGFALFDLDETLRVSVLPVLKEGITAP